MHLRPSRLFRFVLVATSLSTLVVPVSASSSPSSEEGAPSTNNRGITVDSESVPEDVDPSFYLQPIYLEHCLLDPTLLDCPSDHSPLDEESFSDSVSESMSGSTNVGGGTSAGANLKYKAPLSGLDAENYTVAPPELELEQVHVYVRHGMFVFFHRLPK